MERRTADLKALVVKAVVANRVVGLFQPNATLQVAPKPNQIAKRRIAPRLARMSFGNLVSFAAPKLAQPDDSAECEIRLSADARIPRPRIAGIYAVCTVFRFVQCH